MMNKLWMVFAILILTLPALAGAHSVDMPAPTSVQALLPDGGGMGDMTLKTGRYAGQFRVNGTGRAINAVLELFYAQDGAEYPKLQAALKLVLGDFSSPEYMGYTYENVLYDPNSMLLTLDGSDQDIVLSDVMAMGHSQMLMGKFQSVSSGVDGTFDLRFVRSFDLPSSQASTPIAAAQSVEPISGDYQGLCGQGTVALQIETERSSKRELLASDPFSQNQITGSYGTMNGSANLSGASKLIALDSGTYDFFKGELNLHGTPKNISCQVNGNTLHCGGCTLTRTAGFSTLYSFAGALTAPPYHERGFKLDRAQYPLIVGTPEAAEIQGRYFGYLHHEQTDLYQPMSLDVVTAYHMAIPGSPLQLYIIPTANLYFGRPGSDERIPYRFDRRPWLYSQGWMELSGSSETYAIVREWRKGMVVLDWYSRIFGRVGTVELLKGKWPSLPPQFKTVGAIAGKYTGPTFDLSLQAGASDGSESEPFNPYYPLVISGETVVRTSGTQSRITDGVYDFYTGAISFANAYKNHLVGARTSDLQFQLFVTGNNVPQFPLLGFHLDPYVKSGSGDPGHSVDMPSPSAK